MKLTRHFAGKDALFFVALNHLARQAGRVVVNDAALSEVMGHTGFSGEAFVQTP